MSAKEKDSLEEDAAAAETGAVNGGEGCSEEAEPTAYDLIKDMWVDDHEVQIYQEVMRREKKPGGHPDLEDINAMEEPLYRLIGAVALFEDLSIVFRRENTPRRMGLSFLAQAMNREALRLYRLYHGHPPRYSE